MELTFEESELKLSKEQIIEVIDNGSDFDLAPSQRGNDRLMFVGFTHEGELGEVGVEFLSETKWHVFHAMPATKPYRELFGQKRK